MAAAGACKEGEGSDRCSCGLPSDISDFYGRNAYITVRGRYIIGGDSADLCRNKQAAAADHISPLALQQSVHASGLHA